MAKDRREKTCSGQVDLSKRVASRQSGQTGAARPGGRKPARKKKRPAGKIVLMALLVILILVIAVFVVQIGKILYNVFLGDEGSVNPDIQTETYDTTPVDHQNQVEYYLVGMLGPKNDSIMDMLTLLCYDKQNKTVNCLEVPVDTYLGDSDTWDVRRVGFVWNNPRPLKWCDVCRRQVSADEIKDGKHAIDNCGATITEKAGSPYRDLIRVFNEQYSLPVDHYYILPQQALVQLVDLVGGIDIELSQYMMLADKEYPNGVQTLSGKAVLDYVTERSSGVSGDLARIVKSRQVWAALFSRLCALDEQELANTDPNSPDEGVIGEVMTGPTPIRTDSDTASIAKLLKELQGVSLNDIAMFRMPGEAASLSGSTFFSVHADELLKLLQAAFDPYGEQIYGKQIAASDLNITEIAHDETADTKKQTMAEVIEEQKGKIETTAPTESGTDTTNA